MACELRNNDVLPGEDEFSQRDAAEIIADIYEQFGAKFVLEMLAERSQALLHEALDPKNAAGPLSETEQNRVAYLGGREINALRMAREYIEHGEAIMARLRELAAENSRAV